LSICRVIFTGTVIVIPDILALASPGERSECRREASQRKGSSSGNEGVRGLRALGVRDLSYRLAFIANSVQVGYLWFVIVIFVFYDVILFL
jgi:DNA replication licensing factor MCM6